MYSVAALPANCRMNPTKPETAKFYDKDQIGYVIEQGSPSRRRLFTSFGSLGWRVGEDKAFHHDQTLRDRGVWRVVGVVNYATGARHGVVPDYALGHWVAK